MIKVVDHSEITQNLNAVCQVFWPRKKMKEIVDLAFNGKARMVHASFCHVVELRREWFIFQQASGQICPIALLEAGARDVVVNQKIGEELASISNGFDPFEKAILFDDASVTVGNIEIIIGEGGAWCFRCDGSHTSNIVYLQEI